MPHQSDARNRCIVALWNSGMSTTAIGRVLGISRNVVAGVVQRARLRGEQVEVRGAPANIAAAATHDSSAIVEAARKPHQNPTKSAPKSHQWPAVSGHRLSDDPHEPVGCRWIEGEPRATWAYCQQPTPLGRAWCKAHYARAYRGKVAQPEAKAIARLAGAAR